MVGGCAATRMESAVAKKSHWTRKRDGEVHKPECEKVVASVEERCGILQRKQQGSVSRSSSSSALWLSEVMCPADVVEKSTKRGNLDRHTTLVNVISHQHEITVVNGKMKLRWGTKIQNWMHEEKF